MDRNATRRLVQHAEKRGIKALFITVDAPQLGRREKVIHITRLHRTYVLTDLYRTCVKNSMPKILQSKLEQEVM
jgi:isopentenyl diphosphate isomerase/L-lactate dehydrogenase-like FMN-dependent dehydrogenase